MITNLNYMSRDMNGSETVGVYFLNSSGACFKCLVYHNASSRIAPQETVECVSDVSTSVMLSEPEANGYIFAVKHSSFDYAKELGKMLFANESNKGFPLSNVLATDGINWYEIAENKSGQIDPEYVSVYQMEALVSSDDGLKEIDLNSINNHLEL